MKNKILVIALCFVVFAVSFMATYNFASALDNQLLLRERQCAVEFSVFTGFNYRVPNLILMVDGNYESFRTNSETPTMLYFDVNNQLTHFINVLDGKTPGGLWSGGFRCDTPANLALSAYLGNYNYQE